MKIRNTYILRNVAGENLVVPIGDAVNFNSVITLNSTGKFLWELLQSDTTKEQLEASLCSEYGIDLEIASRDVAAILEKLKKNNRICVLIILIL